MDLLTLKEDKTSKIPRGVILVGGLHRPELLVQVLNGAHKEILKREITQISMACFT